MPIINTLVKLQMDPKISQSWPPDERLIGKPSTLKTISIEILFSL